MLKRNSINVHLITRQPGLEIWRLSKVRTRPAGRIFDFGNFFTCFFIVFTKNPYLLLYIWHTSIFFWLNTRCMLNALHENVLWCDQFYNLLCKGSTCFHRPGLIEWVQFVLQNCEKLQNYKFKYGKKINSVRGLYVKRKQRLIVVYLRRDV